MWSKRSTLDQRVNDVAYRSLPYFLSKAPGDYFFSVSSQTQRLLEGALIGGPGACMEEIWFFGTFHIIALVWS